MTTIFRARRLNGQAVAALKGRRVRLSWQLNASIFTIGHMSSSPPNNRDPTGIYALVGELVTLTTMIDFQLSQIIVQVFSLGVATLIVPVVATLDIRPKIEMLKKRAKIMPESDWRTEVIRYCKKVDQVTSVRNIVCHSPPELNEGVLTFRPAAIAKMMAAANLETGEVAATDGPSILMAIKKAEAVLMDGANVFENFKRLSRARAAHERIEAKRLNTKKSRRLNSR